MPGAELGELQALFHVPPGNPMYDCWLVQHSQVAALSRMAGVSMDLSRFDYFVEAYAAIDAEA